MIKAYLDSYNEIKIKVSKDYNNGIIQSLYLLTAYGPEMIGQVEKTDETEKNINYIIKINLKLNLGEEYYLLDEHGYKFLLEYRFITKTKKFIDDTYTNEYLGYKYSQSNTSFSLWAPVSSEVLLVVNDNYYKMKKNNSVFNYTVEGDLEGHSYFFMVKNNGVYNKVLDPYSYSYNFDQSASVVVDLAKIEEAKEMEYETKSKVIYEVSVRDFSSSKKGKYKGKFLGTIDEENIEHLTNLGIEYLQLMPINYFNGDVYNNGEFYSWGYNANLFGVPHCNYVYNSENGKEVINECKKMITTLHDNGIKVLIDLPFDHLENRNDNNLNLITPYYFYLMDKENVVVKEDKIYLDCNTPMMKRFIVDMCARWIKLYGVDGFRFNLSKSLNAAIKDIYKSLREYKRNVFISSEGLMNNYILSFNDKYKEKLIKEEIDQCIFMDDNIFNYPINYIEKHDGYTYYDFLTKIENKKDEEARKIQLFKTLVLLMSNGYAFMNSGQEFYRTKKGNNNSCNSLDNVNTFDWNRLYKYSKDVNLIEKMIRIREKYSLFDMNYEYKNDNGVITLSFKGIKIVLNLSNEDISLENNEILLATNSEILKKYDLVIYKSKGGKSCLKS